MSQTSGNILDTLASCTRKRIEARKNMMPQHKLIEMSEAMSRMEDYPFWRALQEDGISFICEVKRASPSKGLIAEDFPCVEIARAYEAAGAAAISVLTEPSYFMGHDSYLSDIALNVSVPLLRKDFTVDEYMIYEARCLGAAAVLLICAILTPRQLTDYIALAKRLGLSALVEAHSEDEVKAGLDAGAEIIGVNNRDLKTFKVDMNTSVRLRQLVPDNVLFVAESGIRTAADVAVLRDCGVDAVLVGETLMRSSDKKAALAELNACVCI